VTAHPSIPKAPLVATLVAEWATIADLLGELPEADWRRPTPLPGWSVQDNVAHIVGTECMLSGEQAPPSDVDVRAQPHVRNDIGAANEQWVQALRADPPARVLERLRDVTGRRAAALEAMSQSEFDAPSWTPAGEATYGRFMQIRLFDCWMHEQDIRDGTGRPGHEEGAAAEESVDEALRGLGFAVGKRAAAPQGSVVTFELTGPVRRTVHVVVDGRARVVDEAPGPSTTLLRMPSGLFTRLTGGRIRADAHGDELTVEGDQALGRQVADNLAFTI
jgi:uncharacterized protein (TIGR03083 family)